MDGKTISKEQFKLVLENQVQCWSQGAQFLFLERLFNAFDVDNSNNIDCEEFMTGLSVFLKGTPEEKLMLSFRIYDVSRLSFLIRVIG